MDSKIYMNIAGTSDNSVRDVTRFLSNQGYRGYDINIGKFLFINLEKKYFSFREHARNTKFQQVGFKSFKMDMSGIVAEFANINKFKVGDLIQRKDGKPFIDDIYQYKVEEIHKAGFREFVIIDDSKQHWHVDQVELVSDKVFSNRTIAINTGHRLENGYLRHGIEMHKHIEAMGRQLGKSMTMEFLTKKENKMIIKPKTKLEKSAAKAALESATKLALDEKQKGYDLLLQDYIEREHSIIKLQEKIKSKRKIQKEVESKLNISKKDKEALF